MLTRGQSEQTVKASRADAPRAATHAAPVTRSGGGTGAARHPGDTRPDDAR